MSRSLDGLRANRALMAYTAAAMYGGAAADAAVEAILPGDPSFAVAPAIAAAVVVGVLLLAGPRMPRAALAPLGPIGVALIAVALSATPGAGDGAVLYMWPVLWTTFFFGRRGAVTIVLFTGVAHALALLALPPASSYPGRWVDVMVSVTVVAGVVLTLVRRNDNLLERLAGEARTDSLTGLLNRRGFQERAEPELARTRREGGSLAIAEFDIDYFKRVNDEWGHEAGDRVLVRLGRLLASQAREADIVARFGGEEFVVLMPGGELHSATAFAERIRLELATADESVPHVRVSAGVTAGCGDSIESMLHMADSALYRAKRAGRDRIATVDVEEALSAPAGADARLPV